MAPIDFLTTAIVPGQQMNEMTQMLYAALHWAEFADLSICPHLLWNNNSNNYYYCLGLKNTVTVPGKTSHLVTPGLQGLILGKVVKWSSLET